MAADAVEDVLRDLISKAALGNDGYLTTGLGRAFDSLQASGRGANGVQAQNGPFGADSLVGNALGSWDADSSSLGLGHGDSSIAFRKGGLGGISSSRPGTPSMLDVDRLLDRAAEGAGAGAAGSGGNSTASHLRNSVSGSTSSPSATGMGMLGSLASVPGLAGLMASPLGKQGSSTSLVGNGGPNGGQTGATAADTTATNATSTTERLYVRVDQPVEGCGIEPYAALLRTGGGAVQDSDGTLLSFKWMRSTSTLKCAYIHCKKNTEASSATGSSSALGKASSSSSSAAGGSSTPTSATAAAGAAGKAGQIQCLQCLHLSVVAHEVLGGQVKKGMTVSSPTGLPSVFCGRVCFRRGWAEHAQYHRTLIHAILQAAPPQQQNAVLQALSAALGAHDRDEAIYLGPLRSATLATNTVTVQQPAPAQPDPPRRGGRGSHHREQQQQMQNVELVQTVVAEDGNGGSWEDVAVGRSLVPSPAHVGRKLRLEVRANLAALGQPGRTLVQYAETSIVLPQPQPALRRRFVLPKHVYPPSSLSGTARETWLHEVQVRGLRDSCGSPTALRVMCYNILAEIYASQNQYPYVPLWQLSWSYRCQVVLRELLAADADVLCLQEVQSDAFASQISTALSAAGYEALYKTKTREAMGVEGKIDGCATFYKRSRFRLSSYFVIELNEAAEAMLRAEAQRLEQQLRERAITSQEYEQRRSTLDLAAKRLCKDNVAQVAVLHLTAGPDGTPLGPEKEVPLLVVCTHLHWDPNLADVKLWQMSCLLKEVEKLQGAGLASLGISLPPGPSGIAGAGAAGSATPPSIPLLLCGDLNSEPNSGVYKLLGNNVYSHVNTNAMANMAKAASVQPSASSASSSAPGAPLTSSWKPPSALVRVDLASSELPRDPCGMLPTRGRLGHNLPLASLYRSVAGAEPEFTNYTGGFIGCLDYVWHNIDCVKPLAGLAVPTPEQLTGRKQGIGEVAGGTGFGGLLADAAGGTGVVSSATASSASSSASSSGSVHFLTRKSSVDAGAGEAVDLTEDDPALHPTRVSLALPNAQHPSDHLPLIFDVDICVSYSGTQVVAAAEGSVEEGKSASAGAGQGSGQAGGAGGTQQDTVTAFRAALLEKIAAQQAAAGASGASAPGVRISASSIGGSGTSSLPGTPQASHQGGLMQQQQQQQQAQAGRSTILRRAASGQAGTGGLEEGISGLSGLGVGGSGPGNTTGGIATNLLGQLEAAAGAGNAASLAAAYASQGGYGQGNSAGGGSLSVEQLMRLGMLNSGGNGSGGSGGGQGQGGAGTPTTGSSTPGGSSLLQRGGAQGVPQQQQQQQLQRTNSLPSANMSVGAPSALLQRASTAAQAMANSQAQQNAASSMRGSAFNPVMQAQQQVSSQYSGQGGVYGGVSNGNAQQAVAAAAAAQQARQASMQQQGMSAQDLWMGMQQGGYGDGSGGLMGSMGGLQGLGGLSAGGAPPPGLGLGYGSQGQGQQGGGAGLSFAAVASGQGPTRSQPPAPGVGQGHLGSMGGMTALSLGRGTGQGGVGAHGMPMMPGQPGPQPLTVADIISRQLSGQ